MNSFVKTVTAAILALTASTVTPAIAFADDAADTTISAGGNKEKGKRLFNRCRACHNLTAAPRTRVGPNLDNIFGRKSGTAEGFRYSKALLESDFTWTEQKLDEWLTQPRAFLPGNKMAFAGLRKEQDRKDLIAYLREATLETTE
jgi:cytochrome c